MDITYLGHSSFKISGKSVTVVTDPYRRDGLGWKYPKVAADIVTVSHEHDDHNQVSAVEGDKKVISGPGMYEIAGVSIVGIGTFHDDVKGADRGKNTVYIIEIDGRKLVHLGDLGHKLAEGELEVLSDIDILFVPVGGVYTIGPKEAVEIVRDIDPKVTIPMHFADRGINEKVFGNLAKVDEFVTQMGVAAKTEDKLAIKNGSILPDENQVVILNGRQHRG